MSGIRHPYKFAEVKAAVDAIRDNDELRFTVERLWSIHTAIRSGMGRGRLQSKAEMGAIMRSYRKQLGIELDPESILSVSPTGSGHRIRIWHLKHHV